MSVRPLVRTFKIQLGGSTVGREYLVATRLPPKVATKYLMELVVPRNPVAITVGMLLLRLGQDSRESSS